MKTCDRKITEAEFVSIADNAERISQKDYTGLAGKGPLIKFAHRGDAVIATAYYGQGPAGEPGNHFFAA